MTNNQANNPERERPTPPTSEAIQKLERAKKVIETFQKRPELPANFELEPILERSQALYNFLNLKVDLKSELDQELIELPTRELIESAPQLNLDDIIIVSSQVSREELIEAVDSKLKSQGVEKGLYFYARARQDLNQTLASQNRPAKGYFLFFSSNLDCRQSLPQSEGKSAKDIINQLIPQLRQQYPGSNLRGLRLEEYLLIDSLANQERNQHLDSNSYCWLTEELIPARQGNETLCLDAYWNGYLKVHSFLVSGVDPGDGARLAAVSLPERSGAQSRA